MLFSTGTIPSSIRDIPIRLTVLFVKICPSLLISGIPSIKVLIVLPSGFLPTGDLIPKGPRVFWCKTTQNYPLLKKELVILF
jgi:hypothetical protein